VKTELRIRATQVGARVKVTMEVGYSEVVSVGIGDDLGEALAGCFAVSSADVAAEWMAFEQSLAARQRLVERVADDEGEVRS
jgi:hypothetical protein